MVASKPRRYKGNYVKKMYKVNVPVVTIENEENEQLQKNFNLSGQAISDNWKRMYRNLLTPAELDCLISGRLVNDLIIEAFLK